MSDTSALITRVSEEEGIAWLTLNRPERKNALSKALMAEIIECLKELRENDRIRCIVTTGAGDSFCSGLDLYDLRESWRRKRRWEEGGTAREIITLLRNCPQVTIAAINGYCLGGGMCLLNGHDIAFAADNAKIGMPEVIRGSYGAIATPTLFSVRDTVKKSLLHSTVLGKPDSGGGGKARPGFQGGSSSTTHGSRKRICPDDRESRSGYPGARQDCRLRDQRSGLQQGASGRRSGLASTEVLHGSAQRRRRISEITERRRSPVIQKAGGKKADVRRAFRGEPPAFSVICTSCDPSLTCLVQDWFWKLALRWA